MANVRGGTNYLACEQNCPNLIVGTMAFTAGFSRLEREVKAGRRRWGEGGCNMQSASK